VYNRPFTTLFGTLITKSIGHWQMYLFSHLTYFIRLTLSDSRCGILTLTDPQGLPQGRSSLGVMSGGGGGNVYRGLSSATLSG